MSLDMYCLLSYINSLIFFNALDLSFYDDYNSILIITTALYLSSHLYNNKTTNRVLKITYRTM